MPDLIEVRKALDCRWNEPSLPRCERCHYGRKLGDLYTCAFDVLCHDANVLLREQEPVPPIEGDPVIQGFRFVCGKCHWRLYRNNNYCSHCGKKVKWSDANGKKMDQKT